MKRTSLDADGKRIARKKKRRLLEADGKAPRVRLDRRAPRRADGGSLLHAAGYTPQHVLANVAGLPGDLYDLADVGGRYLISKGAEKLGMIRPDEGQALRSEHVDVPFGSHGIEKYLNGVMAPAGGSQGAPAGTDDQDRRRGGRRRSR